MQKLRTAVPVVALIAIVAVIILVAGGDIWGPKISFDAARQHAEAAYEKAARDGLFDKNHYAIAPVLPGPKEQKEADIAIFQWKATGQDGSAIVVSVNRRTQEVSVLSDIAGSPGLTRLR